jgi:hypothetical protein
MLILLLLPILWIGFVYLLPKKAVDKLAPQLPKWEPKKSFNPDTLSPIEREAYDQETEILQASLENLLEHIAALASRILPASKPASANYGIDYSEPETYAHNNTTIAH